jgi:SAM-dependent methyltransferase
MLSSIAERYRRSWPRLVDEASRADKAGKVLAALAAYDGRDLASATCVDVGCGAGIIAAHLAGRLGRVVACDLDPDGVAFARERVARPNLTYLVADATRLPLADGAADVAICMHVYEHVGDAERLAVEIRRVLRPGGVCFFSGPNRLRVFEPHLRLPFIHWLPRPVVDAILRRLGRPRYEESLRTRWGLARLLRSFEIVDLNLALVRDPARFHTGREPGIQLARQLPDALLVPLLALFAPSFNLLLRKPVAR